MMNILHRYRWKRAVNYGVVLIIAVQLVSGRDSRQSRKLSSNLRLEFTRKG